MPNLEGYREQDRVLIISGGPEDIDALEKQRTEYETHLFAARDRRLEMVEETIGPFRVRLVGLDGETKYQWNHVVEMAAVFAVLDQMPRRQEEIQNEQMGGAG